MQLRFFVPGFISFKMLPHNMYYKSIRLDRGFR